jgi:7,8-dihydropterin-6-yl-methyl-4-(beta-D-ribofuranosyl)aminobenzene 5'-phosphate synthase
LLLKGLGFIEGQADRYPEFVCIPVWEKNLPKIKMSTFTDNLPFPMEDTEYTRNVKDAVNLPQGSHMVILFNNCYSGEKLRPGFGFSAWISHGERVMVFDTGSDARTLTENIGLLGLDTRKVTDIFISHNHWDHVYGLAGLARLLEYRVRAFVPASAEESIQQQVPGLQVTGVGGFSELYPGIWTTGEMETTYRDRPLSEQALVLVTSGGLVIVTGCTHPGLERLITQVRSHFPGKNIRLLSGGFHLGGKSESEIEAISDFLKQSGVEKVAPSHCTGDLAIEYFRKEWGNHFLQLFLGDFICFV